MNIPNNLKTYDMRTSTVWFGGEGIIYAVSKPNAPFTSTDREILDDVKKFKNLIGDKKVCVIVELDPRHPAPLRIQRNLIGDQLKSIIKALAIIITSPSSKMGANLFFVLKPADYPVKVFNDIQMAEEWIREICKKINAAE